MIVSIVRLQKVGFHKRVIGFCCREKEIGKACCKRGAPLYLRGIG